MGGSDLFIHLSLMLKEFLAHVRSSMNSCWHEKKSCSSIDAINKVKSEGNEWENMFAT
jgi:hypothetical protein